MIKKANIVIASILMLSGVGIAIFLHDRANLNANHHPSHVVAGDQTRHQQAGEDNSPHNTKRRVRPEDEDPELVAKYGLTRTLLARKINGDVLGILELDITMIEDAFDPESSLEEAVDLKGSRVNLTEKQRGELMQLYLEYEKNFSKDCRQKTLTLKENPSLLTEYLLMSDAIARGKLDTEEKVRFKENTENFFDWDSSPLENPDFIKGYKSILGSEQISALDTYLERIYGNNTESNAQLGGIFNAETGMELEKMNVATESIKSMFEALNTYKELNLLKTPDTKE